MSVTRERGNVRPGGSTTSFGGLLRAYRRSAGLTQEQLAERAGYSTVYVSMLEREQRFPLPATIDALAAALGLAARDRTALERAARLEAARGSGESEPALVGREREMALLEQVLAGEGPQILALAGDPGMGKTRLLREAALRAGAYGLSVLEGGCLRRGGQEPYAPLVGALQSAIRSREERELRRALAGCGWLVRLLPELMGGPVEPLPGWAIPEEQERRLIDDAVIRFLENVAGPRGTVLLLDDLQWAGEDALDLIRALVHASPVRIIAAYRHNETSRQHPLSALLADLAARGSVSHLTLAPLSHEAAGTLLEQMLEDLPQDRAQVRERVLQRAEGVPFFVVSCAQALRSGDAGHDEGEVPWTMAQSIRQRVALLPESAQDVLGLAAIVGRLAPYGLLTAVGEEESVAMALDAACRAQLLQEDGGIYQFKHDVIREVIENDLGAARRMLLHRQIGRELERQGGGVEALAYHFVRGGDEDKALRYLEQAGEKTEAQHANATAEGYYRELVDRLDRLERSAEAARARERLGRVLRIEARYQEALEVLEGAARAYQMAGDVEGEARAVAEIGRVHAGKGAPEAGIDRLAPLRARLSGPAPSPALAALDLALAPLFLACSRYREQLHVAQEAAALARVLGNDRVLAEAEVWRGCALNQIGELEEGRRVQKAAIPLAEAVRDPGSLSHALNDIGHLCEIEGSFEESRTYRTRALAVAEQAGDPAALANMAFRCGQNAFLSGQWDLARQYFDRSIATAARIGALSVLAYPLFGLALLALVEGSGSVLDRAQACLDVARVSNDVQALRAVETLLAEGELRDGRPEDAHRRLQAIASDEAGLTLLSVLPTLALACLRIGDVDAAQSHVAAGIARARSTRNHLHLVDLLRVQGLIMMEQGRWSEAHDALDEGLRLARPMPYPYAEARLLHTRGVMQTRSGEPYRAGRTLAAALTLFQQLGALPDARLSEEAIAGLPSAAAARAGANRLDPGGELAYHPDA